MSILCAGRATRLVGGRNANFWRITVAFVLLGLYAHTWGRGWQGEGLLWFLMGGVVGIGIGDVGTFQALQTLPARLVVLLVQCLCAPFAALIEWSWLGTQLTGGQMVGSAVILCGTALCLLPGLEVPGQRRVVFVGVLLSAFSSFAQAMGAVMTRKAIAINEVAGISLDGGSAAYQRMIGGFFTVLLFQLVLWWRQRHRPPVERPWRRAAPWIFLNGSLGLVLGLACFQWALSVTPAAVVLSIVALTPLLTMPLAWWMDGDRPPWIAVVGAVVAVGGVLILQRVG